MTELQNLNEPLTISGMLYGADAVARTAEGKTVFVRGGVPGDVANVRIVESKPTLDVAEIERLITASPDRVDPQCAACGGCPWARMAYPAQLQAKRANIVSALMRIGKFDHGFVERVVAPCAASPCEWGYRNKLELHCATDAQGRLEVGLMRDGSHELEPIASCPLAAKSIAKSPKSLRGALRRAFGSNDYGLFRIGVRASQTTGDVEVALWTAPGPFPRAQVAGIIKQAIPTATSVTRVLADPGAARKVKNVEQLSGKGFWHEQLSICGETIDYLVSSPSFFQVNTAQAQVLVETVLDGLGDIEDLRVADLYSGGGTFSIPLALAGADVAAVESAKTSVRDLRRNADANEVYLEVIGGDAAHELPEIGALDALVVDPPRAGLASEIIGSIVAAGPRRIAYVSCDPATLARDLRRLADAGYQLESCQPVDLFPQTYHVETVALLGKKR